MSALKITERKADWIESDPYELFELAEAPATKRGKAEFYGAVVVGALIASIISLAVVWSFYRVDQDDQVQPYAYLEVKAIGPDGRPVVGALVKTDGEPAGVTDAFGEWRRFMRVPLGGRVALTMMKRADEGMMSAVKTLQVPTAMPETGDIEVIDRIQLTYLNQEEQPTPPAAEIPVAQVENESVPETKSASTDQALGRGTHVLFGEPEVKTGVLENREFSRVWIMADTRSADPQDATDPTAAFLHKQVVSSLRQRARQLGLVVDPAASWRVTVRHVSVEGGKGLIETVGSYHESVESPGERLFSFLTNYTTDAMDTARGVMFRLAQHTPVELSAYKSGDTWLLKTPTSRLWQRNPGSRYLGQNGRSFFTEKTKVGADFVLRTDGGAPCAETVCQVKPLTVPHGAPKAGWELLPLKIMGAQGKDLDVYVAGFAAVETAPGGYQFWGTPGDDANLTILEAGRVIHRGKVVASVGREAQVSLPVGTISRR